MGPGKPLRLLISRLTAGALLVLLLAGGASARGARALDTVSFFGIRYDAGLASQATLPETVLRVPFGPGSPQVGGIDQDQDRISDGIPFAFLADEAGQYWLLDTVNQTLKKFSREASLNLTTEIPFTVLNRKERVIARDLCRGRDGTLWLLLPVEGKAVHLSPAGKPLVEIEGLNDAAAIGCDPDGNLMVVQPMADALMVFDAAGTRLREFRPVADLSEFTTSTGDPLGVRFSERQAVVFRAEVASPTFREIPLATFSLSLPPDSGAVFTGARLLGRDRLNRLYVELIAGNEDGVMFQHRLYRFTETGTILGFQEIKVKPYLAPGLPRHFTVTPDGRVLTYVIDNTHFSLAAYSIPETAR